MTDQLEKYIADRTEIDTLTIKEITAHFSPVCTKKNQVLADIGDTCQYIYFINKGELRFYYLDKNGNESTWSIRTIRTWPIIC